MKSEHSFKLIAGKFMPQEARSILFTLVNSKINYHTMESFGITERTSGDTSFHEKRIKELSKANVGIRKVLDYADKNNIHLSITGDISIKLINESEGK